jgi:hypothetical protein
MSSKDKGGLRRSVFTATGAVYSVRCKADGLTLEQALSLRAIIHAFESSAIKRGNNGKDMG